MTDDCYRITIYVNAPPDDGGRQDINDLVFAIYSALNGGGWDAPDVCDVKRQETRWTPIEIPLGSISDD